MTFKPWNRWAVALVLGASGCQGTAPDDRPLRVLYVGNSRVYYYNQPSMLAELARVNGRSVHTRMLVEGGATLADLIGKGAIDSIRAGRWDVVVLNEQSTWGMTRFVEGAPRVPEAPEEFLARVDSLTQAAGEAGARLVLIAHARQRTMPELDGDALIRGFARAVERNSGIKVAPLEVAWRLAGQLAPAIELYDADGNHPTPTSALLTALLTYRAIFGHTPAHIPTAISAPWVELREGKLMPDSIVEVVRIDSATAMALRTIASAAVDAWPGAVARARTAATSRLHLPRLYPPTAAIDPATLRGRWVGELRLYPRFVTWPATMTLDIRPSRGRATAALRVAFGGSPEDIVVPILPVSNEGAYLQFVDPDGPNGGIVRYRVAPAGDTLAGIAEFVTDGTVYGIGSIMLRRAR